MTMPVDTQTYMSTLARSHSDLVPIVRYRCPTRDQVLRTAPADWEQQGTRTTLVSRGRNCSASANALFGTQERREARFWQRESILDRMTTTLNTVPNGRAARVCTSLGSGTVKLRLRHYGLWDLPSAFAVSHPSLNFRLTASLNRIREERIARGHWICSRVRRQSSIEIASRAMPTKVGITIPFASNAHIE